MQFLKYVFGTFFLYAIHVARGHRHDDHHSHDSKDDLAAFSKEMIVPDLLNIAPKSVLTVNYGDLAVHVGNNLTPTQVKDNPNVTWKVEPGKTYLLCFLDPDVPGRTNPIRRSFIHWMVGNIQGNDLSTGEVLSEYIGSGPPKGSGLHRYTFLLFEQPGKIEFQEKKSSRTTSVGRVQFSIRTFAEKHNLGNAIAGNFFQAEWDDYVPTLYAQLKDDLKAFSTEMIVPDVLDVAPKRALGVSYGNVTVYLGNTLTPTQVKEIPNVIWKAEPGKTYLLCFLDPDVPSRTNPIRRQAVHWMVGNIQGNDLSTGEVLAEYIGSGPPKGSGLHRYTFLVFEQPGKLEFHQKKISRTSVIGRPNFSIRNFAQTYKLGSAIAGNFFQAEWDDYVSTVHAQFKDDLMAFSTEMIVPDVLDVAPKSLLGVDYGNMTVYLGNALTPTQVKEIPSVTWKAEAGKTYLLCLLDPDAPSRTNPIRRSFQHWLVGNIQGNDLSTGENLTEYVGAGPPQGSGLHRYTFLLFEQPGKIEFQEKKISRTTALGRPNFSIPTFAKKYNLGNAIAGNFFQAEWDDYVATVHAQFKGGK